MSHRIQHLLEHLSPQSHQHLHDVQMTYGEHVVFSGELSARLLYGAYAAFMHALIPSLYTSNTTELVTELQRLLNHAHNQQHTESQLQEANHYEQDA